MADRSLKLLNRNHLDGWSIVGCIRLSCLNFWTKVSLPECLRSRAAPTRPESEKPRKSRKGKRSKRLKRQQPERKEKYRKRQCRANHVQHHQLSKLSATHDVQHRRSGKNFQGGASRCPNPTPRGNDAIQIVFRIRSRWVSGYLGRNNSAIAPNPPPLPASPPGATFHLEHSVGANHWHVGSTSRRSITLLASTLSQ